MRTVIFLSLLLLGVKSNAQNANDSNLKNIVVQRDARLDVLVKKTRDINEDVYLRTIRNMQGFRVQVINTNDRNKALEIKTKLLSDFPDEKTYLIYHSPYFKIQIGNFRSREDADKLLNKVKSLYSTGVFVVPSRVEIKPSKNGDIIL